MKISALDLGNLSAINLKPVKMERLGSVVAIAGRNGAGKSRLLRAVEAWVSNWDQRRRDISQIEKLRRVIPANPLHPEIKNWTVELPQLEERVLNAGKITFSDDRKPRIVRLVPSELKLTPPSSLTRTEMLNSARTINEPGVGNLPKGTFARIQACQNRYWEVTHPQNMVSAEETTSAISEYERLKQLVRQFLNAELYGESTNRLAVQPL